MGKILFIIIITVYIAKSENAVPPTTHPYCVSSKHQRSPYISSRQVPHAIPYHDQTIPYQLCWKIHIVRPSKPLSATCQKVHPWLAVASEQWMSLNFQYLNIEVVRVSELTISPHCTCACLCIANIQTARSQNTPWKNWLADLTKVKRFIQSDIWPFAHVEAIE